MATAAPDSGLKPQQQQAVDCRDASVVLASGAGCGKTHVLTRRYLSHLQQDSAEVNQIVAITFTERRTLDRSAIMMAVVLGLALGHALHHLDLN